MIVPVTDNSFILLAYAECDDSLPFSGASSIPLCYITFSSSLFHQLVFHCPSLHLAIYFLVSLSALLFPNSYIILFWHFCFLPLSVQSIEQKSIGVIFRTSRSGSDVRYSCHHNLSRFSFPVFVHSWRFSVLHSLQSITPRLY